MRAPCWTRSATPKPRSSCRSSPREKPDFAEAWLVLGTLQVQDNQLDAGRSLAQALRRRWRRRQRAGEERSRGLAQAYLSLSQLAEKRKDFAAGRALAGQDRELRRTWWRRRTGAPPSWRARASWTKARELLRALPERTPADARMKLMAEVQLLRDDKQYQPAYDLLAEAAGQGPATTPTCSTTRPCWPRSWATLDEMERLLRQLIAAQARLPPRLQRAGLFAGRSQHPPARSASS